MTSINKDTNNEEKKDDSVYSHGEVVSEDNDVEIALSPRSPEDKDVGTFHAEDVPPASTTPADSFAKTWCRRIINFYIEYDVLVLLVAVILLAYAYPPLGAIYLEPQITASWVAVMYIFCKYWFIHVFGISSGFAVIHNHAQGAEGCTMRAWFEFLRRTLFSCLGLYG